MGTPPSPLGTAEHTCCPHKTWFQLVPQVARWLRTSVGLSGEHSRMWDICLGEGVASHTATLPHALGKKRAESRNKKQAVGGPGGQAARPGRGVCMAYSKVWDRMRDPDRGMRIADGPESFSLRRRHFATFYRRLVMS